MFAVFIVFPNGHNIKIESYQYEENAIAQAEYHAQWAKCEATFQVCHNGDILFIA